MKPGVKGAEGEARIGASIYLSTNWRTFTFDWLKPAQLMCCWSLGLLVSNDTPAVFLLHISRDLVVVYLGL